VGCIGCSKLGVRRCTELGATRAQGMSKKGISFGCSRMLVGGLIQNFPMKSYLLSMGHIIRLETKIWCETGQH
jgi:hypothetical protein